MSRVPPSRVPPSGTPSSRVSPRSKPASKPTKQTSGEEQAVPKRPASKRARPKGPGQSRQSERTGQRPDKAKAMRPAAAKLAGRQHEQKVYGEKACIVLFAQRPEAIIRLYVNEAMAPKCSAMMKYLAGQKKAYHIVADAELEKVAGSQHHGGVVLLVKQPESRSIETYLRATKHSTQDLILALDGVSNPHNLGAIARTCAHFGVKALLMADTQLLHSGAAVRTAAGGAEFIEGVQCTQLPAALLQCQLAGYKLLSTSSHQGESLYQLALPAKAVMVFGEEMFGVSKQVAQKADILLKIPGTGKVESLNVGIAAALIIGEWFRQHHGGY